MIAKKQPGYKKIIFLLIVFSLLFFEIARAQKTEKIISPEWLQNNLKNDNLRIIDMRADIREYWAGHIPGAVYLDETALRWPQNGVPGKLIPIDVMVRLLEELGINKKTTIIIYTEINNYRATYLAWALDYLGHESWAILEGGFERWKKEGRPVTQDFPVISRTTYGTKIKPNEEVRAYLDQVKNRDPETTVLIDVRPAELYSGQRGNWKRKGHIKGAINFFWASVLNEDGTWKDLNLIRENLASIGITPDKTIIVSCGQGLMSSHTYLLLKYLLGFPKVKNYDGSFNEWSNHDELPVETSK